MMYVYLQLPFEWLIVIIIAQQGVAIYIDNISKYKLISVTSKPGLWSLN